MNKGANEKVFDKKQLRSSGSIYYRARITWIERIYTSLTFY